MAKSIDSDTQKNKKRVKVAKIIAVIAAVLLVAWTIYSIATNINDNERLVLSAFVKHYREVPNPTSYELKDCSKIYDSTNKEGKAIRYVIINVEHDGKAEPELLIVKGKNNGKAYTESNWENLDCADADTIKLQITEKQEDIRLDRVNKTIDSYWNFHDVV